MNLHEFQAKDILKSFGINVQEGLIAKNPNEAINAAKKIFKKTKTKNWIIKAQIHAGGRGKNGGIKLAKSLDEVKEKSAEIIGKKLITPQTPPEGKKVYQVLITEDVYYPGPNNIQEFYISIMLNRNIEKHVILYSSQGGVDIELLANEHNTNIFTEIIDPMFGLQKFQVKKIVYNFGLKNNKTMQDLSKFIINLYNAYVQINASLLEINPVIKTSDNKIIAVDSKIILDDNALFKHPKYQVMRDLREEDPSEVEAGQVGLNFIKLNGNIGCMVNGAGLAMATMDMIKLSGGSPANFLDVGGSANAKRVKIAFQIILNDPNVKAILINIFGGIVRCDRVAEGILDAYKSLQEHINIPIIVRLEGTNSDIAKKMIHESNLKIYSVITLEEAANKINQILN